MRNQMNNNKQLTIQKHIENQLIMKTVQSFFPTRAKTSNSAHRDIHYNLIKKSKQQQFQSIKKQQNIFRDKDNHIKKYSLDENIDRPIGGIDIFKKMEKINNFIGIEESSKRLQRKSSKKNIKQSKQRAAQTANIRQKSAKLQSQKKKNQTQFRQQTFKSHNDHKEEYTRHSEINQLKNKNLSKQNSQSCLQKSKTSNIFQRHYKPRSSSIFKVSVTKRNSSSEQLKSSETKQNKWATQQQKNYLDKMAFLNQIYYNRPLIQKFGNQYFECMLRNRFEDEPEPAKFIYQIKDKFSDSKFIHKLKKYKPNLLERNKLKIQGYNKMRKEQQKKQKNKGKQRWEDWQSQQAYQY